MSDILFAVGWLALLAVAALFFTAIRTMTRAKTTINPNAMPEHLVTSGPFGITRNPIYLANTLLLIGVGLRLRHHLVPAAGADRGLRHAEAGDRAARKRWLAEKFGKKIPRLCESVSALDLKRVLR